MKRKQRNEVTEEKSRPNVAIKPWNTKQRDYLHALQNSTLNIATGSAGTGKTYLAASVAAQDLANKRIGRIVISRANVATGKSLGAFPGTVEEKMAPWLLPVTDVLQSHLGAGFYAYALRTGVIQFQPIETIRGRSFDNAVVLIDEAQQLTKHELMAIVTRIGRHTRLVLMGDNSQRDTKANGLEWLIALADKYKLPVELHEFNSDDVVRSDICKLFVKAFEQEDNR
jgi:phosphate starvation-inducible PhoH-like protein